MHEASKGSFSRVFDFEANDVSEDDNSTRTSPFESRFPINIGITGHVAMCGEVRLRKNQYNSKFPHSTSTKFDHFSFSNCFPMFRLTDRQ